MCPVQELYEPSVDISLAAPVHDERQRGTMKIAGRIKRWPEMGSLLFIKICDVTTNLCFCF